MKTNYLYSDLEAKLDTILCSYDETSVKRYDFWRSLKIAMADYKQQCADQKGSFTLDGLDDWLFETYGLRIHRVDGMIGQTYTIFDEAKFLFFTLKYS